MIVAFVSVPRRKAERWSSFGDKVLPGIADCQADPQMRVLREKCRQTRDHFAHAEAR